MESQKSKFKQNPNKKHKIKNLFLLVRCVKEEIVFGNKKFKVYVIKDSHARATTYGYVVSPMFLKDLNKKEQIAILYHEEYHKKIVTLIKRFWYPLRFLSFKKARWQEEFNADRYASKKMDKKVVKSFLEKAKKAYQLGKIVYNPKSHPPINDRIKMVL